MTFRETHPFQPIPLCAAFTNWPLTSHLGDGLLRILASLKINKIIMGHTSSVLYMDLLGFQLQKLKTAKTY